MTFSILISDQTINSDYRFLGNQRVNKFLEL